jgi:beta-glucanase (GH16 family)
VPKFKHDLCMELEDNFNTFDTNVWEHENLMSGFGNGEFEMTSDSSNNSFVRDGMLYIVPTLTSDVIGPGAITNNHIFNLTGCSSQNYTDCSAVSNSSTGAVINPVMSARISTRKSHSIRFGRVEIRAKLPRGDWIWPALWMLPKDNVYGEWPISGEIDVSDAHL